MKWIKDENFIRGSLPMTKFEIRVVTMAVLEIEKGDSFLDIGAGTGSVSIEAALQGAQVYSIEMEDEGVDLINRNAKKFGVTINVIKDSAPSGIDRIPKKFNKCFIGGSCGRLSSIFGAVDKGLTHGGILTANFVTLKNLSEFQSLLKEYGYIKIDTRLIQSSQCDSNTGIMKAQNPVFIVKGEKP